MTAGNKTTDNTAVLATYDIVYPTEQRIERGNALVGGYWSKSWNGADAPPRSKEYETTYFWLPGERRPRKRRRVVRPPKRAKFSDHQYSMALNVWQDRAWDYQIKNTYPPYAVNTYGVRTFRQVYAGKPSPDANTVWSGNDDLALIGKLREKIAGSDFNAGVFLGEGHQTVKLIADSATRLYKAYRAVQRFDTLGLVNALGLPKTASLRRSRITKGTPQDVANMWLEVQYGWLPLVNDAEAGAQMLAKMLNTPLVQTYRARKRKALALGPYSLSANIKDAKAYDYTGTTRGQYIARLSEVNIPQLIGLTDPASVAWELVPFSFVADWFIPIGNYLAARGLAQSLTGTFVKTITREERFSCGGVYISPQYRILNQPSYREHSLTMTRTVSSSLAVPLPNFKPLAKVASWKHCANAVALLVQTFGSGKLKSYIT